MAVTTTILKLTQIQGVVKVHAENGDTATIALATTLKKSTETQSSPKVNIRGLKWFCDKNAAVTITRNGAEIYHLHGSGSVEYLGYSDNQEQGSDILVTVANGDAVVILDCTKVSGYGPQSHQNQGDLG